MPLVITHQDDTELDGITLVAERGVPSDVVDLKIYNTGSQDVVGAYLTLYAEETPGSGIFVTQDQPAVDERMGRFEITGQDSSVTPGQEIVLGQIQPMGHLAVAQLPIIKPGNSIFANFWIQQAGASAGGGAINLKLEIANERLAYPLPNGVAMVGSGINRGTNQARSFLVIGRHTTATGSPDDEVHVAAGEWLIDGVEYEDATIQDVALDQNDNDAETLAAGESYIAVLTQGITDVPTVTKGLKGTAPTRPTPPAGELVLAWVTVDYNAGGGSIPPRDIGEDLLYWRYRVGAPPTGLAVMVEAGEAITADFYQVRPNKGLVVLLPSSTNRIWLEYTGAITVTQSDDVPSPGALKLAQAVTNATDVTALTDTRRYIQGLNQGALEVVAVGGSPSIPNVTRIRVPLGALTDNGGGEAEIDLAAGDITKADKTTGLTATDGVKRAAGTDLATPAALSLDFPGLTATVTPDPLTDLFAIYDDAAGEHRKLLIDDFLALIGLGGGAVPFTTDDETLTLSNGLNNNVAIPVSSASILTLKVTGLTGAGGSLTGLVAPASGKHQILVLIGLSGTAPLTVEHAHLSSSIANRIAGPGSSDFSIIQNDAAIIVYDFGSSIWRTAAVIKATAAGTFVFDDGTTSVSGVDSVLFTGGGAVITNLGAGAIEVDISAGGGGGAMSDHAAFTDPALPSWAWYNQGSATDTLEADGSLTLLDPASANVAHRIRGREIGAPSTPFTITIAFCPALASNNLAADAAWCGIYVRDSVLTGVGGQGSSGFALGLQYYNNSHQLFFSRIANVAFVDRDPYSVNQASAMNVGFLNLVWMRLTHDGTNLIASYSSDGKNWTVWNSQVLNPGGGETLVINKIGRFAFGRPMSSTDSPNGARFLSWLVT